MFNRKYTSSNSEFSIIIIMLVFRVVVFGDVVFTNPKNHWKLQATSAFHPTYSSADLTASPGRMVAKDLGMSIRRYKKNKNCWVILLMVQKSSVHQLGGDNRINKKNSKVKSSVCASLLTYQGCLFTLFMVIGDPWFFCRVAKTHPRHQKLKSVCFLKKNTKLPSMIPFLKASFMLVWYIIPS